MSENASATTRDNPNTEGASEAQSSGLAMPQAFQFMTEFRDNMQIFNQTLLPIMTSLVTTAVGHDDTINYLNPLVSDLRRRINALETRADRLEANRGADNAAFQGDVRTNPAGGSTVNLR